MSARVLNPVMLSEFYKFSSTSSPTMMKRRNLPSNRKLNHIKKDLFGTPNPNETKRIFEDELEKHQELACKKWGFDFRNGYPIVGNNQFIWERVGFTDFVPEMYTALTTHATVNNHHNLLHHSDSCCVSSRNNSIHNHHRHNNNQNYNLIASGSISSSFEHLDQLYSDDDYDQLIDERAAKENNYSSSSSSSISFGSSEISEKPATLYNSLINNSLTTTTDDDDEDDEDENGDENFICDHEQEETIIFNVPINNVEHKEDGDRIMMEAACDSIRKLRKQSKITEFMKVRKRMSTTPKKEFSSPSKKRRLSGGITTASLIHKNKNNFNNNRIKMNNFNYLNFKSIKSPSTGTTSIKTPGKRTLFATTTASSSSQPSLYERLKRN